jgi:hypothetical protein
VITSDLFSVADIVIKVTVLLAVAALASRAHVRGSAAARHQIWAIAIVASLAMPIFTLVAPRWTIAVLPAAEQSVSYALQPGLESKTRPTSTLTPTSSLVPRSRTRCACSIPRTET